MQVYLGLGSNLGDRQANLARALKLLGERLHIELVSSLYETEPVDYTEQPLFLNAICRAQTELGPMQLLSLVKGIEASLGRVPSFPNAPRPIDIDIIFYGDRVMETPDLTIPHPRLEERAFVLIPLLEVAPDLRHPVSGEYIKDLAARVGGREGVKKIGELRAEDV
ncbi:MAG: 2-amino-4-hydroxy-6-hydroxymethyldihydropteridine diphosphokinase [Dehalococcoidia bacterium]|nr:2-amino-4-hydroxy-6-hydroxymethyldihydropteridine diphosphokinase [Dehalococcoidia bacterium]